MTVSKVRTRDRDEFVWTLAKEGVPLDVIRSVLKWASAIQRLASVECCRELTAREQSLVRSRGAWINRALGDHGIKAAYQGDPRGACVKLKLPSGRSNDFGGEGYYCVPTPGW